MMTVVYMDNNDIYQLFINFNVPGVRKEVARLAQGVNTGNAGVMNELLQAAYDPSAGQQAMQAGEQVQQPCLANDQSQLMGMFCKFFDKLEARDVKQDTYLVKQDAREAAMSTYLVKQDAKETAFHDSLNTLVVAIRENHDVVQQNFHIMDEKLAETDAIMADNKAEIDAMIAENKADTDAKIAVIMSVLTRVATGCAPDTTPDTDAKTPDTTPDVPKRTNQRYSAVQKQKTLQWLLEHISDPYPNGQEIELLRKATGIDTPKRMSTLVTQIRTKEMVKDKNGKWSTRVKPKHASVLGKKRAWTQKNINDMM
jgi:hypothetical protein